MQQRTYHTKEVSAKHGREMNRQIGLVLTVGDIHFMHDLINKSAFYVEWIEAEFGEDQPEFWELREHALRVLTDWLMRLMEPPTSMRLAA